MFQTQINGSDMKCHLFIQILDLFQHFRNFNLSNFYQRSPASSVKLTKTVWKPELFLSEGCQKDDPVLPVSGFSA